MIADKDDGKEKDEGTATFNHEPLKKAQLKYEKTEKAKARKRKWAENMTEEQREKQRLAKKESQRRKRAAIKWYKQFEENKQSKQTDC